MLLSLSLRCVSQSTALVSGDIRAGEVLIINGDTLAIISKEDGQRVRLMALRYSEALQKNASYGRQLDERAVQIGALEFVLGQREKQLEQWEEKERLWLERDEVREEYEGAQADDLRRIKRHRILLIGALALFIVI